MMHMMRWTRSDVYHATCDCARHVKLAGKTHYNAVICIMDYCVTLVLKPYGYWDGIIIGYKFEVMVRKDSDYAKCTDTRRSMTKSVVYLNGVQVTFRSSTMKMVSLLTTEAELNAAVIGVQDALFIKNILKSIVLKVKLPIVASINNGRALDIGNA